MCVTRMSKKASCCRLQKPRAFMSSLSYVAGVVGEGFTAKRLKVVAQSLLQHTPCPEAKRRGLRTES